MPDSVTSKRSAGTSAQQVERGVERDLEGAQVAVVDADQRRLQPQRAVQLGAVVHFDQHRHAERLRRGLEVGQLRVVEDRRDQQDAVGADRARLVDLVGVDDEVLAQHRQLAGTRAPARGSSARPGRSARRSAPTGRPRRARVARGDLGRHEALAQHALARARLLDLGDHRGAARRRSCAAAPRRSPRTIARAPRHRGAATRARAAACAAATSSRLTATMRSRMSLMRRSPRDLSGFSSASTATNWLELGLRLARRHRLRAPARRRRRSSRRRWPRTAPRRR